MSIGTFDAFTSARLGIYAAQHGLNVTGNNISNINTVGYTRQRIDQVSFKAGAYDRYRSQLDNHVGSGALVMGINQIRDPYLDVRYRNITADVGYNDRMLAGLQEVADILDEIGLGENPSDNEEGDGLLHAQIQDLADKLREYGKYPSKANNDLVRTSAEILCQYFNDYADKLDRLYQDTMKDFDDQVTEINECLTNIRDLNREIRDCEIYGDNALELRDERNRQIDKLSQYLHIKVVYSEENIGGGQTVEKLSIYLDNDNPDPLEHKDESMLIDGVYGAQISRTQVPTPNPNYDPNQPFSPTNLMYLDEDGNPCKLADAAMMDHPNYNLTISKLVDFRNEDWKGISTVYEKVDAATQAIIDALRTSETKGATGGTAPNLWTVAEPATKAIYSFNFTPSDAEWSAGDATANPPVLPDQFSLRNPVTGALTNYTIGTDITADDANDPEKMAEFIAKELDGLYADYDVTAVTDADGTRIQFAAKTAGAIPTSDRPRLNVSNDPAGKLTFSTRQVITAGKDAVLEPPADQTAPDTPPGENAETITSYRLIGGEWNKVSTIVRHTEEVDLGDNDIHGSLQATRELLTEKGEFASQDTVDNVDKDAESKRGIQYYQLSLDLLARQFATQYNKINQGFMQDKDGNTVMEYTGTLEDLKALGVKVPLQQATESDFGNGYYADENGNFIGTSAHDPCDLTEAGLKIDDTVDDAINRIIAYGQTIGNEAYKNFDMADDGTTPLTDDQKLTKLKEFMAKHGVSDNNAGKVNITLEGPFEMGGLLFSNRNDRDSEGDANDPNDPLITAANISVSHSWSNGDVELVPTYRVLFLDEEGNKVPHTTQTDNAAHMLNLIERSLTYNPQDIVPDAVSSKLFEGSFGDMFIRMSTICGQDIRAYDMGLNTAYGQQVEIDTQRDGVSGVDLNDEAMNMMQYQKAMTAAMRLMTVIDDVLDRLINNTAV